MLINSQIQKAIYRYARTHKLFARTVARCSILRFAAIRAYRQELLLSAC